MKGVPIKTGGSLPGFGALGPVGGRGRQQPGVANPNSNHRLAYNWGDSDETGKSVWTNIEFTGTLDNGANYGSVIDYVQVGLLDVGECLVDNLRRGPAGPTGPTS